MAKTRAQTRPCSVVLSPLRMNVSEKKGTKKKSVRFEDSNKNSESGKENSLSESDHKAHRSRRDQFDDEKRGYEKRTHRNRSPSSSPQYYKRSHSRRRHGRSRSRRRRTSSSSEIDYDDYSFRRRGYDEYAYGRRSRSRSRAPRYNFGGWPYPIPPGVGHFDEYGYRRTPSIRSQIYR